MAKPETTADDLFAQGSFEEALQKYEAALRATPDDSKTNERLGFIHFFKGRYKKGNDYFQKVIELDPSRRALMLTYIAFSHYLMQDYSRVVRIMDEIESSGYMPLDVFHRELDGFL